MEETINAEYCRKLTKEFIENDKVNKLVKHILKICVSEAKKGKTDTIFNADISKEQKENVKRQLQEKGFIISELIRALKITWGFCVSDSNGFIVTDDK